MGYVFISYSSKNSEQADRIKGILNKNGIETWMAPESIPAGSEYVEVLYDALIECSCLVLLLTEESQASKWVKKEVNMAIGNDKTIVPLKLEEFELNKNMKLVTTDLQITVLKDISEESAEMKKVLSDIIAYTGKKTDIYIKDDNEAEISEEVTEIDLGEWLSGNPTPSFDGYTDDLENSEDALAVELQALYDDIMSEKREKDSTKTELQESEQTSKELKEIEAAINAYNEAHSQDSSLKSSIIIQTSANDTLTVYQNEILFIAMENRRSNIYLTTGKIETKHHLEFWKSVLNQNIFAQPHSSCIVNLNYVEEVTKEWVKIRYRGTDYVVCASPYKIGSFKKSLKKIKEK